MLFTSSCVPASPRRRRCQTPSRLASMPGTKLTRATADTRFRIRVEALISKDDSQRSMDDELTLCGKIM